MSNLFDSAELHGPRRVLVLGDLMLDQYTWGRAERVSPEAPVLVMQAETCDVRLGGAGAVAGLLRGLDAEVLLAGVVGDDPEGRIVRHLLDQAGIEGRLVQTDAHRPTTHKHRFLATVEQRQPHQILRVDHERTHPLAPEIAASLAEAILLCAGLRPRTDSYRRSQASGRPAVGGSGEVGRPAPSAVAGSDEVRRLTPSGHVDAVLISDYAKGVCTPELLARVIGAAREQGLPVLVDPARIGDYERYRGATLVKPNRRETELVTGRAIHSPADAVEAGRELVRRYDFQAVVVTLDGDGMALVTADGLAEHVPTRPRQVADITGAGDMALAVLGLCVAEKSKSERVEESKGGRVEEYKSGRVERSESGGDSEFPPGPGLFQGGRIGLREAVELANVAAGLEVERVGVVPVTRAEIVHAAGLVASPGRGTNASDAVRLGGASTPVRRPGSTKVVTLDEMAALAAAYRREGKTVVFTNGCFDLLHVGHVTYLEQAATLGDVLVVAVNSDESVRRLGKGSERPIVSEADRTAMLAALACVDHILIFEEATPHRLLEAIRPDVLVKGGTYAVEQVVGHEIVERFGGRVCVTGMRPGVSTTKLVAEIRRSPESRVQSRGWRAEG
jgi:D-beta-D-heptose 7-phosphate kinase / D-beta-D-heptose 1-phosphate adenosyltransferase